MKTIIIDDNQSAIDNLVSKLEKYTDIHIAGTATNGTSGMSLMQQERPDLLFLDVELPDMSGIDFLNMLKDRTDANCHVVIYTAYSDYMISAFRSQAFDFLLKPVDESELDIVMRRIYADNISHPLKIESSSSCARKVEDGKLLFYTNTVDFRFVQLRDIGLFQYCHESRVWEIVLAGQKSPLRLKRSTNNTMLLSLEPCFIQVNQKYIININYLLSVNDNICHFYPPFEQVDYVNVGCFYRRKLINRFNSF